MAGDISINCGALKASLIPYGDGAGPWSQEMVDTAWKAIGYPAPAPRVPATIVGRYTMFSRGPRMFSEVGNHKKLAKVKHTKAQGKEIADFMNFWGKAVTDPCRKQSGISKVAGGLLQVASFVVPVAGAAMFAVAEAGNAVLDAKAMARDMNLGTKLLTQAAEATTQVPPVAKVAPVSPPLIAPVSQLVPQPMSLVPRDRVSQVTQKPGSRWTRKDWAIAAGAGAFLYLLVRRMQR